MTWRLERIERGWTSWRGRPGGRLSESLLWLLPDEVWSDTEAVGGW
ncbi:hypothetical protein ACFY8S_06465 [Streptomyces hygroscopicus]